MDTLKVELTNFESLKDLKPLLASPGPCLSVFMPLDHTTTNQFARANPNEWRDLLKTIEPQVEQNGAEGRELAKTVADWQSLSDGLEQQGKSVAIFRSPSTFRLAWIQEAVAARAVIAPHFYIRPLLPELTSHKTFYILALSLNDVRLLRCTLRTSEEVSLAHAAATNFDSYMDSAKPDHVSEHGAATGPAAGAGGGMHMTTGTTAVRENRDNRDEYVAHFFRQLDRALIEALRGKTEPVILAGVEHELALYRSLTKCENVQPETVEGAPNSLKAGEMHARAIDAIRRGYERKVDEQLAEYNHRVGGGGSNRLKEILPAAYEGRVLTLLISDSLEATGAFDEATFSVKGRETGKPEDEDLVNDAAVQTILHAGQVYVVPNSKMPNGSPLAATYRF